MRSHDWQPMETAPLNPYGKAYGPVVLIWCSADDNPWPAYYSPWHGWESRDCGPAWVIPDQDLPIAPEDAVAWMPIAAPSSEARIKESLTAAEPVMPAEIWCTPKKTWHFTDGYGTRYVRGDLAFRFRREHMQSEPDWRPIDTAPRDGTPFLTFSADAADDPREGALGLQSTPVLVMAWQRSDKRPYPVDEHGDWHDFHCYEPTHWMPLPNPPSTEQETGA